MAMTCNEGIDWHLDMWADASTGATVKAKKQATFPQKSMGA